MKNFAITIIVLLMTKFCFGQLSKPLPKHFLSEVSVTIREAFNDGTNEYNQIEISLIQPSKGKKGKVILHYNRIDRDDIFEITSDKIERVKNAIIYSYYTNDHIFPVLQIKHMFPPMMVDNDPENYSFLFVFSGNYNHSDMKYKKVFLCNELSKN